MRLLGTLGIDDDNSTTFDMAIASTGLWSTSGGKWCHLISREADRFLLCLLRDSWELIHKTDIAAVAGRTSRQCSCAISFVDGDTGATKDMAAPSSELWMHSAASGSTSGTVAIPLRNLLLWLQRRGPSSQITEIGFATRTVQLADRAGS